MAVSAIRMLLLLYIIMIMETSTGTYGSVRYSIDVRYWECPLMESSLYAYHPSGWFTTSQNDSCSERGIGLTSPLRLRLLTCVGSADLFEWLGHAVSPAVLEKRSGALLTRTFDRFCSCVDS